MAKQQQTTQCVMYITIYKAGWPSGQRRQTQENFSLEISGTRMCAWVQIPLLSEIFKHCEVSQELKIMQNQKQFCFWKPSGIRTRLESSRSKLLLHQSVLGFTTCPCKNTKIKLMLLVKCTFLHWQSWLFDDQLITWKMKFQKIEAIWKNKLRIWTVQITKQQQVTQSVMYITIYKAGWLSGLRRQTQENFSLEISGKRMSAWVQIPLLSEIFEHCEVSHELKIMQNQKQFCFWKPSGIRTRLESSPSKLLLHQSVLGFKTYPCQNRKIEMMHLVKGTFLHWQNWLSTIN